jgi:hypothetical protein
MSSPRKYTHANAPLFDSDERGALRQMLALVFAGAATFGALMVAAVVVIRWLSAISI